MLYRLLRLCGVNNMTRYVRSEALTTVQLAQHRHWAHGSHSQHAAQMQCPQQHPSNYKEALIQYSNTCQNTGTLNIRGRQHQVNSK
jgi:hypothetical protein